MNLFHKDELTWESSKLRVQTTVANKTLKLLLLLKNLKITLWFRNATKLESPL